MEFYKMNHEVTEKDIKNFNMENQRIGVIVHIEDKDGNILLQQRGLKSRDENGLFEDVGGSLEEFDTNYRAAIIREMYEEMGKEAKIELSNTSNIYNIRKNNEVMFSNMSDKEKETLVFIVEKLLNNIQNKNTPF